MTRKTLIKMVGMMLIILLAAGLYIVYHEASSRKLIQRDTGNGSAQADRSSLTPMTFEERMGIGNDGNETVREYLLGCSEIESIPESLGCYEAYYSKNDEAFRQGIEGCGSSSECLDDFYYGFASTENSIFCNRIIDEEYRRECITSIK